MTRGPITTRELVVADYDRVLALWKEMDGLEICEGDARDEIQDYLKRNPALSRVAEEDGRLAGAVLCGHDGRRGFIYHLAVDAAFRGRGIGQLLVEDCVRGLRDAGIKRATLLVAEHNPRGHEFWVRNGWEDIEGAIAMTRSLEL